MCRHTPTNILLSDPTFNDAQINNCCIHRSLWISDTACAALMSPIAYALLEAIMIHKMAPLPDRSCNGNPTVLQENGDLKKTWVGTSRANLLSFKNIWILKRLFCSLPGVLLDVTLVTWLAESCLFSLLYLWIYYACYKPKQCMKAGLVIIICMCTLLLGKCPIGRWRWQYMYM